jgi:hypothetical protein
MPNKTITIFLPEGNPKGCRTAEFSRLDEKAILIPRSKFKSAFSREENKQEGIYFLFGTDDEKTNPIVYIGETKNGIERIEKHNSGNKKKVFWDKLILIISKNKRYTKTHIEYLEALSISVARECGRFELENKDTPKQYSLPESMESDLQDSFETLKTLVSILGYPLFESLIEESKEGDGEIFYCSGKDGEGEGLLTDDGFVIFKGSICQKTITQTAGPSLISLREKLINDNILSLKDNTYVFSDNQLFSSPSAAANQILGRRSSGWIEWKNKEGKTLDELKRK